MVNLAMMWILALASVVVSCLAQKQGYLNPLDPRYRTQTEVNSKKNCTVCETEECVSTAARILDSLDTNTKPCDDFYQFACGGWIVEQIIPPHRTSLLTLYDRDKHLAAAKNLLANKPKPSDLIAVKKAKDLYASCIAYASRSQYDTSIVELIQSRFGTWPLTVEDWDDDHFDLEDFLIEAFLLGVYPLIRLEVGLVGIFVNEKIVINHLLVLSQPDFGLPLSSYVDPSEGAVTLKLYTNKIYSIAKIFGIEDSKTARRDAEEIVEVETALVKMLLENNKGSEKNFTLAELDENFGQLIKWSHLIISSASSPRVGITDITPEENVTANVPGYLTNMTEYFSQLPNRTQANYIIWRVLNSLETVLAKRGSEIQSLLDSTINGITAERSPVESCITYVSKAFNLVVHRMLYTDKFPPEEMKSVYIMLKNIQKEFDEVLNEHDWVDEASAKLIREKNAALATTLLYFEQSMNDTLLETFYANVTVHEGDFIKNVVAEREEAFFRNLRLLRKPYQRRSETLPHEMVAQNNFLENQMQYTSIVFEPPAFTAHVPQSVNYGGVGVIFGHEIVHAFDTTGSKYNTEGLKGEWWSNETASKFEERVQCMIDQYSKFFYEEAGMFVDGKQTLGENIADNGGAKLAYRAYKKYVESIDHEEQPLPGVDFTPDQLLFINFAQMWCKVETQKDAAHTVLFDEHSPPRFRVIGTAQNSEDFARVFNCPKGSKMNPENKCEVW